MPPQIKAHVFYSFCFPPKLYYFIFFLQGEVDETALDINFSGSLAIDKIMPRYIPGYVHLMSFKLEDLNGETKVSGSLLKP